MTTERPWPAALTDIAAAQIRRYRQLRGMSTEELAKAVSDVGLKYSRDQVINLERKERRRTTITVGEIVAFGAVLGVPPALLVMPAGLEPSAEVLPGHETDSWNAYGWFTGLGSDDLLGVEFPAEADDVASRVGVYRRYRSALAEFQSAARLPADDESKRHMERTAVEAMVSIRRELRPVGQHLPPLPADLKPLVEAAERELSR